MVADIRKAVFDHIIGLSPGFFETTRTGEVLSRLTTDTTLLQIVVGSSVSIALRNAAADPRRRVMLVITSPKLTGLVLAVVPLVVVPIVLFGRKVRRLSRASQDRSPMSAPTSSETLNAIRTVQAFAHEAPTARASPSASEEAFAHRDAAHPLARAPDRRSSSCWCSARSASCCGSAAHDVLARRITAGDSRAFVFYAVVVAGAVGRGQRGHRRPAARRRRHGAPVRAAGDQARHHGAGQPEAAAACRRAARSASST